jgi:integral membrane protein
MTRSDITASDPPPFESEVAAVERPGGLLIAFRVMAYVVGVFLLLLCASMVLRYGFDDTSLTWSAQVHGFLYAVYLVITFLLAQRLRWPMGRMVLVLLAGTVPFLSFVAERRVTARIRAESGA